METNKAVALDAVVETTGSDPDSHNQNRTETNSQSQQPEAEHGAK